jgi:hypothetical protein
VPSCIWALTTVRVQSAEGDELRQRRPIFQRSCCVSAVTFRPIRYATSATQGMCQQRHDGPSRCRLRARRWRWWVSRSGRIRRTCSATKARRLPKSVLRLVTRRSNEPALWTFDGTICGPYGQPGTCRMARRCSRCRSWAVGRVPRWCAVMRNRLRITLRRTRNVLAHCVPFAEKTTAQIRHRGEGELGVAISRYRVEIGAVEWIRTTDLLITNQLLYQLSYNSPE